VTIVYVAWNVLRGHGRSLFILLITLGGDIALGLSALGGQLATGSGVWYGYCENVVVCMFLLDDR
jgi:hypothetical protein